MANNNYRTVVGVMTVSSNISANPTLDTAPGEQTSKAAFIFVVTCYATLHPTLSVGRSVGPLFGQRLRRGR